MQAITRFAPSPTGLLHVGNAYAALCCDRWAKLHDATMLLRIEDIDHTRCQPSFSEAILTDLNWLGLTWPQPVRRQSAHLAEYQQAIDRLRHMGVIYPCFCTRKAIANELARMGVAPHANDNTPPYPGTCRHISESEQAKRMQQEPFAWRLDIGKAATLTGGQPGWRDTYNRLHPAYIPHDVVIGRKDIGYSYHLAVVVDDAAQGVTHIIRGEDLQSSTGIHRLLQSLLGFPEPIYMHHRLLKTPAGERLAKRTGSTTLRSLRNMGVNPERLQRYLLHKDRHLWPFMDSDKAAIVAELG